MRSASTSISLQAAMHRPQPMQTSQRRQRRASSCAIASVRPSSILT